MDIKTLENKNFYPTPLYLIERMLSEYSGYENDNFYTRKSGKQILID